MNDAFGCFTLAHTIGLITVEELLVWVLRLTCRFRVPVDEMERIKLYFCPRTYIAGNYEEDNRSNMHGLPIRSLRKQ